MTKAIVVQKRKHPAWLKATWIASLSCICGGVLAHAAATAVTPSHPPMHAVNVVQDKNASDVLELMLFLHRQADWHPAPSAH